MREISVHIPTWEEFEKKLFAYKITDFYTKSYKFMVIISMV